jgi:hypothetical protein
VVDEGSRDVSLTTWVFIAAGVFFFAGLELFAIGHEFQNVLGREQHLYPWGWEGGGWAYSSRSAYMMSLAIQATFPITWLFGAGFARRSWMWFVSTTITWFAYWLLLLLPV